MNRSSLWMITAYFLIMLILFTSPHKIVSAESSTEPLKLVVLLGPEALSADGSTYPVFVQIQDENGSVTLAPEDITVHLFSSEVDVATVQETVSIHTATTHAIASLKTTVTPGKTIITAAAVGYQTGTAEVTTVVPGGVPAKISVYPSPRQLLPEQGREGKVIVQVEDVRGTPALAPDDIVVRLSSSKTTIGTIDSTITIPRDGTFAVASFESTYLAGSTIITASASGYATGSATISTIGPTPARLAVYAAPPQIPADGKSKSIVVVQLQDLNGVPAIAPSSVDVSLSSSETEVGEVDSSVIIPTGVSYATATFTTGGEPGETVITASASGYETGFTVINCVQTGYTGEELALYMAPATVLPDKGIYGSLVVQILDKDGNPVEAPSAVTVTLSSSNLQVGSVDPIITITQGNTYTTANFRSTYFAGSTIITASSSGYTTAQLNIESSGPVPAKLSVRSVPPILHSTGATYEALLVELQDLLGNPAKAPSDIIVELSSSKTDVVTVDPTVTISSGETFAVAKVYSTPTPGTTVITATASGYASGNSTIETVEPFPNSLAVFAAPPIVQADGGSYDSIIVQLRDRTGNPAKAQADIPLFITSSDTRIGSLESTAMISVGSSYSVVKFRSTTTPGSTEITAASTGYTTGTATISTVIFPLSVELKSDRNRMLVGDRASVEVKVTSRGAPIEQADLLWYTPNGTIANTSEKTSREGKGTAQYISIYPGNSSLTVIASKPGFRNDNSSIEFEVDNIIRLSILLKDTNDQPVVRGRAIINLPNGTTLSLLSDESGMISAEGLPWGSYNITVLESIQNTPDVRYYFKNWEESESENATISSTFMFDADLSAVYGKQYILIVTSMYGEVTAERWHNEGSKASFSVEPTSVSTGLLQVQEFAGWEGDYTGIEPSGTIVMNSPKTITARWVPNYIQLFIVIGVLGGVAAVIGLLIVRRRMSS